MNTILFKIFGLLTFLNEALVLLFLASPRARALGPLSTQAIIRIFVFYVSATVIGIGLLYLRKWAAVFFSLSLLLVAISIIFGSIWEVPFPLNLINIFFGSLLLLPAIVTVYSWSLLTWRGKWFF